MTDATAPIAPTFVAGDRAYYGKAPCTIISDEGGEMVYIGFGSRYCFKPRAALVPILTPKGKKSTKEVVARGIAKMPKKSFTSLEQQQRRELVLTMREVDGMEQLRQLLRRVNIEVAFSPVTTFGMRKMQAMNKIWTAIQAGTTSIHRLRGNIDGPE